MADTIFGTDGADYVVGTPAAEVFDTGLGDDTMVSGGGADTMIGGPGNDTYIVVGQVIINEIRSNSVTTIQGGRFDTVLVQGDSFSLRAAQQPAEAAIEILSASDPARTRPITLIGNLFGQTITGGAGNDVIDDGGNPADMDGRIYGPPDVLRGLGGDDTYFVNYFLTTVEEAGGGGNDTILINASIRQYGLAENAEIEALTAMPGTASLNLTGNAFSQRITGNDGDNIINGFGGSDTMIGLGGNDTYLVRGPGDVVIEANGGGFDTVYTTVSYNLGANEVEVLSTVRNDATDPINLIGNFVSQYVVGNYGDNLLNGGSGADTLIGLRGNDLYAVGDSRIIIVEADGEGNDTVVTSVDYQLGAGVSVEVLSAQDRTATTALNLRGNAFNQTIAGNDGNNTIDGGAGSDYLIGGGGADRFAFTTPLGPTNADTIADFQVGVDRIGLASNIFAAVGTSVTAAGFTTGTAATTVDQHIIYNQTTGQIYYDADGSGAGAAVLFAVVTAGTALTAASFEVIPPVGSA